MARIKFHKIVAVGVLIVTAAWIATGEFSSVGSARQEAPTPAAESASEEPRVLKTVQVALPPRMEHARTVRISGYTEADKRSVLAARTSGIVEDLPVTEGSLVEEGDVVLRLEAEGKEAALESARQALAQREAEANAAERLAKSGSIASLQLDAARAALASAHSAVELAVADLDRIVLRAPFPGIIDKVDVEKGAHLAQGAEVATLLKLDPIIASGEVSEESLGSVEPGDKAEMRLVTGQVLEGEIRYISRAASPQTRTYRIEVAVPNPDARIPAGMTAEINIKAKMVETVALPRSVVTLNSDGELGIRAVDDADEVHFYPIDIVDDTPQALYLAGVPVGSRIIIAGQDLVTEGEKVKTEAIDQSMIRELAGADVGTPQGQ